MNDRLAHTFSSPVLRYALGSTIVFVILVATGREIVNGQSTHIFELVGVLAFCALAIMQRGAYIGLLVLGAMNGLPFIDTSNTVAHHIAAQDLICLVLIGTAVVWTVTANRSSAPTGLARVLSWCGVALFVWCGFIVARTWIDGQAPLLGAIRFGRDFLYFGALLIVLPRIALRKREIEVLLAVLGVGACLYAVGQIITVEHVANPTWLVHAGARGQNFGLVRLFAEMTDLVFAGVALGIAAVVLTRGRRAQGWAIPVTLLLLTSFVLQLTRARWIAMIASLVVVTIFFALQADRRLAVTLRQRLTLIIAALATVVLGLLIFAPGLISAGPLIQRVLSIFTDVNSQTSTLAVRQHIAGEMTSLLGGHWLTGLGLTPPSSHYYPQFPNGSIRDPDVGVLNAVMTIGLIGAALIYVPLVAALAHCMRRARTQAAVQFPWLSYGGQIWIVATIASSITLVTLFSTSGLVLSAVILALLSQRSVSGGHVPTTLLPETARASTLLPRVPV